MLQAPNPMNNKTIIAVLNEIATLLELAGENAFKVRTYTNAARQFEHLEDSVEDLVADDRLRDLKGVGEALQQKISELVTTGTMTYHQKLRAQFPESLFDLFRIPGLGGKRIKTIYEELGVDSLAALEQACQDNRVATLKGLGAKSQEKILEGLRFIQQHSNQFLFNVASLQAQAVAFELSELPEVANIAVAGSLRRRKEVIKDIDILVGSETPTPVMEAFVGLPQVERVTGQGDTKSSVVLASGIAIDLRVVTPAQFPFTLHHFTGSKEHNVAMRQRAKDRGLKLSEYGLFKNDALIPCSTEAALFAALDLPYIQPELREDRGELALEATPKLLELGDLLGIIHCHTHYSDGADSLQRMAEAAQTMGYQYIVISDHSQAAAYAGGLRPERVLEQHREIDAFNAKSKGIRVIKGIESDILANGALDYEEDLLAQFEIIIASVHSGLDMSEEAATRRVIAAIENPYTTILAHPSGRLLLQRKGYPLDYDKVFDACASNRVAVEINANCRRLDLDWRYVRRAKDKGVQFIIGPDAHDVVGLENTEYGVGIARKGWLEPENVLNCLTAEDLLAWKRDAGATP